MGRSASDTEADENAVHTGEDLRKWEKPSELEGKKAETRSSPRTISNVTTISSSSSSSSHSTEELAPRQKGRTCLHHQLWRKGRRRHLPAAGHFSRILSHFDLFIFIITIIRSQRKTISLSFEGGKGGYSLDPHSHRSPLYIEKPTHII